MCGIVGYIGKNNSVDFLVDGLKRLEYRGYDSAGLAVHTQDGLTVRKCVGRLAALEDSLHDHALEGCPGIGHTRWATHGEPSEINSHPHRDASGRIAVVHNGIIENYQELKQSLQAEGRTFLSQTDTEVIPHLIASELDHGAPSFEEAFLRALRKSRGAYALGVLFADEPDTVYAARLGSPLIIGIGKDQYFIASDVPAIVHHIQEVIYLRDGEIALLRPDGVTIKDLDGNGVTPEIKKVDMAPEAAERAGFETFMLKEMHEQPRVLRALLSKHTTDQHGIHMPDFGFSDDYLQILRRIMIVSCGTAYHAAMYGKLLLEKITGLAVETDLGSEFRYRSPRIERDTLFVGVSQSGETADTLASVRLAREMKCKVFSICNVPGSSLVRESDSVFYTGAGPEIGVASTKAYTAQLMAFALFSLHVARVRDELSDEHAREMIKSLMQIPDAIHYVLERAEQIRVIADKHHDGPSALYLGRRFNHPTALEGALKNKEISYQHAEGYAAGEMKHGPIALINEYLPVICICTKTEDEVYEKMISNMKEVEARHGRIIAIATDGDTEVQSFAEDIIYVPETREEFSPLVTVVALQLLAYYAAQARGTDIDKPRNLAKSVTVE
jgi:glutamine---fructose-6-phosphate transaminase (isomerizing)